MKRKVRLRGSNASRVRQLMSRLARPKFRVGELVRDPREPADLGAIDGIFADGILAAEDDLERA